MFSSADIIAYQYVNLPKDCKMERYLKKLRISHQYVDADVFKNTKQFKDRYFDLIYCGRFDVNKGIVELVEALDYLVNTVKRKLKVMIMGDGELGQQIRNYLIDKDLYGVNYSGYLPQDKVAEFLGNSKFIVIPSHIEGVPKVALEAISCGTIVISSKAGGLRYLIEDGVTGFTIESVDKHGIAEAILRAIDCPIGRRSEILQRYQSILSDYSYNTVVNQYKAILNGL
uniref:Putative glycosyltransferase n=1 Tax=viral metagenome TaxID=1070528 RepID=A0A6M3KWA3_9ZZZZ